MEVAYTLEKVDYQTQVYNILDSMIAHGKLKPGQRLVESELAASLGVSRAPVRVAMVALGQDGLVVNRKGRGWVVSEISLQDVIESYEVRKLIEVHAGKQGCLNCPTEILDEMKATETDFEQTFDLGPFHDKNKRFHELIVLSSGNRKFRDFFLWAMRSIRWCGYLTLDAPGRREQTFSEHREILKGFLTRDQDYLGKAIDYHISSVQNIIASDWNKYGF